MKPLSSIIPFDASRNYMVDRGVNVFAKSAVTAPVGQALSNLSGNFNVKPAAELARVAPPVEAINLPLNGGKVPDAAYTVSFAASPTVAEVQRICG